MAVFADPLDPKCNSYVTLDAANNHLLRRLYTEAWDNAGQTPDGRNYKVDGAFVAGNTAILLKSGVGDFTAGDQITFGGSQVHTVVSWSPLTLTIVSPGLVANVSDNTDVFRFTPNEKESALIWATSVLDTQMDWLGSKRFASPGNGPGPYQNLYWPRSGVLDQAGYNYPQDTVPVGVANCTSELALYVLQRDLAKTPDLLGLGFKKAEIPGPLKVEVDRRMTEKMIPDYLLSKMRDFGTLSPTVGGQGFRVMPITRT